MSRILAFPFLLLLCNALPAQVARFRLTSGNTDRTGLPILLTTNKPLAQSNYEAVNVKNRKIAPAQWIDSMHLLFVSPDSFPAGTMVEYQLQKKTKTLERPPVGVVQKPEGLMVTIRNHPLFFYHTQPALPPADSPANYQRSGFIHPLYSPTGKILTDDFPAGHAHQHGIFMAWVHTRYKDSLVDFWNTMEQLGRVEHVAVVDKKQGAVAAQLKLNLRHRSLQFGEILNENWTVTIYPGTNYFLFDIESDQVNTTSDTLYLEEYRYGGMAFRGSREWNQSDSSHFKKDWVITTSEGKDRISANHTHARWVDASGEVQGEMNGLTIFDHPSNFRYPQTMRVHPDMPYWVYAPVVDGPFNIPPGAHYRSRYRYLVHRQGADLRLINKIEKDWIDPPKVEWVRN